MDAGRWILTLAGVAAIVLVNAYFFARRGAPGTENPARPSGTDDA